MNILGISAFYHDSAACLLSDGYIVAAIQEERLSRKKHDASFPLQAIRSCLKIANQRAEDLDAVVFYDKPLLKYERLLSSYMDSSPRSFESFAEAVPIWAHRKLDTGKAIAEGLGEVGHFDPRKTPILYSNHHQAHAASAFFPSPFENAAILTMDGVGEWATTSISSGRGNAIQAIAEIHFPHSLGLLYSAFTYYCGFKVNSGEYKLMGLAPFGRPVFVQTIRDNIIDLKTDGSFRLDMKYFDYCVGFKMTSQAFCDLFGRVPRRPEDPIEIFHANMAASIQAVVEEVVLGICRQARQETGSPNLCLAGGVALNCVANAKILQAGIFDRIWIQPASGDAGGAVGAALAVYHQYYEEKRALPAKDSDRMGGAFLGPSFSSQETERQLLRLSASFSEKSDSELIEEVAHALADGKIVGWFQGRMEFGPRALGARSILADPRPLTMQRDLNLQIKFRENFRPFAPAILLEDVSDWFNFEGASPYMLFTADVLPKRRTGHDLDEEGMDMMERLQRRRSEIQAVTHVDYSARLQTVDKEINPKFYRLLERFKELTNCPILVNTSFNIRGEPIVCSPEDAYRCFLGTHMDLLAIENFIAIKNRPEQTFRAEHQKAFPLD